MKNLDNSSVVNASSFSNSNVKNVSESICCSIQEVMNVEGSFSFTFQYHMNDTVEQNIMKFLSWLTNLLKCLLEHELIYSSLFRREYENKKLFFKIGSKLYNFSIILLLTS